MYGNALVPGYNVDLINVKAGLKELVACGYDDDARRFMVIEHALMRWQRGEEEAAERGAIDRAFHGIDFTSWRRVLAAAMAHAHNIEKEVMAELGATVTDICYDTEFLDDGDTIDLISIGLVVPQGSGQRDLEYYAVNADCHFDRVREHDWLWANVVPHLPTTKADWVDPNQGRAVTQLDRRAACVKPKWVIANEVRDLITRKTVDPNLWAYYAAYDHVVLAQLWGPMSNLPDGIPMWTHDLMQLCEQYPEVKKPEPSDDEHNALADAQWNARLLRRLRDAATNELMSR